jgi:transposase InsO family protein
MLHILVAVFHGVFALVRTRAAVAIEVVALRQQLAVLKQERPRPRITYADRALWMVLRRLWRGWASSLIIVKPETVVGWHRASFRAFWRWKSRRRAGRPRVDREIRDLIRRMARENRWGAPRIHAELKKLGFDVSERTVSRYVPKRPTDPETIRRWKVFLKSHCEVLAAMDFFVVPTATFRVLYVWFVIDHARRRILHLNVTANPSAAWVIQQLREAFPYDTAPRYLIFDRDSTFSAGVKGAIKAMGTKPVLTAYRSPWQNGVAERWVGSARRELLDHVVVLNEQHLLRLLREYVAYHHEDRCHLSLEKDTPDGRAVEPKPSANAKVIALPRVSGLHHRYVWNDGDRRAA